MQKVNNIVTYVFAFPFICMIVFMLAMMSGCVTLDSDGLPRSIQRERVQTAQRNTLYTVVQPQQRCQFAEVLAADRAIIHDCGAVK